MTAVPATGGLLRRAVPVMGTVVSIHVRPGSIGRAPLYLALAEARTRLHRADAVFSTWKADSPVSRIRRGELPLEEAPPEVAEVFARCRRVRDISGGWFDPWAAPGGVDPTGLVKGWAAARALAALRDAGAAGAMVSAGGDVAVFGSPDPDRPWRIGIQNPFDRNTVVAVAHPPGAIATSGCYERGRHLYDPFIREPAGSLPPPTRVASATVAGPELDVADALATAVAVGGDDALPFVDDLPGYEALIIRSDGSTVRTPGFPDAPVDQPGDPRSGSPVAAAAPGS